MAAPPLARCALIFTARPPHWLGQGFGHAPLMFSHASPWGVHRRGRVGVPDPVPIRARVPNPGPYPCPDPGPCPGCRCPVSTARWGAPCPAMGTGGSRGGGPRTVRATGVLVWVPGGSPCAAQGVSGERKGCGVPAPQGVPTPRWLFHAAVRGHERVPGPVSRAQFCPKKCQAKEPPRWVPVLGWEAALRGAVPPVPPASCNGVGEAVSPHASAVGGAISSPERSSSHLAARRVRVRAEITSGGLAACLPGFISPRSPHGTFACLA